MITIAVTFNTVLFLTFMDITCLVFLGALKAKLLNLSCRETEAHRDGTSTMREFICHPI